MLAKQVGSGAVGGGAVGGGVLNAANGRAPVALVFFYAPWCAHCVGYKPKMVELSADLKKLHDGKFKHIDIVAVDAAGSKELSHKYKIHTYPTFMFFQKGQADMLLFNMEGQPREPLDLLKFFHRLQHPGM